MLSSKIISEITADVVAGIMANIDRKRRSCLCGCGLTFVPKRAERFYYSKECWARDHRIPGMIRRTLRGRTRQLKMRLRGRAA